jgi:hypothetical protein
VQVVAVLQSAVMKDISFDSFVFRVYGVVRCFPGLLLSEVVSV